MTINMLPTTTDAMSLGIVLPGPSQAERDVPAASAGHCTTISVVGDGAGYRMQGESALEQNSQYLLNSMPDVVNLQEQVRFHYGWDPKNLTERVFDLVATLGCGSVIACTVKPEVRLVSGKFIADMQEVAWWVEELGFADDVRLITDADMDPTDLSNAKIFAAVRSVDPEADEAAMNVVAGLPDSAGRSLRDLTIETELQARGYHALIRLLRKRYLRTLQHEVIGPMTIVALAGSGGGFIPAQRLGVRKVSSVVSRDEMQAAA
ncbi:hypothetical protein [Sulfitobacter sp.]|uniref:hypothetical protein n=1 Tax=Sulfitobacter sp. TaxID=1903071 RepID=UPI003565BF45